MNPQEFRKWTLMGLEAIRIRRDRNKYVGISVITKLAFHFTGTMKKRSKRNAIRKPRQLLEIKMERG